MNPGSDQKVSGDLPGGVDFQGLEQEEGRAWNAVECHPQVQVAPEEGGRKGSTQSLTTHNTPRAFRAIVLVHLLNSSFGRWKQGRQRPRDFTEVVLTLEIPGFSPTPSVSP